MLLERVAYPLNERDDLARRDSQSSKCAPTAVAHNPKKVVRDDETSRRRYRTRKNFRTFSLVTRTACLESDEWADVHDEGEKRRVLGRGRLLAKKCREPSLSLPPRGDTLLSPTFRFGVLRSARARPTAEDPQLVMMALWTPM